MSKIWNLLPQPTSSEIHNIQSALNIPTQFAKILTQRGFQTFEQAKDFFRPSWEQTHDPFLMKNMGDAVEHLNRAIQSNEKILLFGDYDVDGTTAVAVMWNVLIDYHGRLDYYIPDRYAEGYGISFQGIDYAKETGVTLIIALDCGIRAIEKVNYAKTLGIDFIICDHHQPGEEIPDTIVLDPLQKGCTYPFKGLSGCGVGFKLLQALFQTNKWGTEILHQQLDLLAISIGADIVPVTDENRIFCAYGLEVLNKSPRLGIKALVQLAKREFPLLLTDVVFVIAPRINAAGRIQSGIKSVELMISTDSDAVNTISKSIDTDNEERKELDAQITFEALQQIEEDASFTSKKTTVVFHPEWHKGVIGIVASRLIETHYRPTIVLTESNGKLTGSARSIKGIDIHEALTRCEDVLEQFGGHTFAAGMTLLPENLDTFIHRFDTAVHQLLEEPIVDETITIDTEISFDDIFLPDEDNKVFPKLGRLIGQMEPFGPGNMKPLFVTKNCVVCDATLLKGEHLKLLLKEGKREFILSAIGFRMPELYDLARSGGAIDIVYTLDANTWNKKTTLQLMIKDIKKSDS
jgi:single-stranded-DNA-specific exonuclease